MRMCHQREEARGLQAQGRPLTSLGQWQRKEALWWLSCYLGLHISQLVGLSRGLVHDVGTQWYHGACLVRDCVLFGLHQV